MLSYARNVPSEPKVCQELETVKGEWLMLLVDWLIDWLTNFFAEHNYATHPHERTVYRPVAKDAYFWSCKANHSTRRAAASFFPHWLWWVRTRGRRLNKHAVTVLRCPSFLPSYFPLFIILLSSCSVHKVSYSPDHNRKRSKIEWQWGGDDSRRGTVDVPVVTVVHGRLVRQIGVTSMQAAVTAWRHSDLAGYGNMR